MKIRNIFAATVLAVSTIAVTGAGQVSPVSAAECNVGALAGDHTQKNITVNGTQATVQFAVKGDQGCTQNVTFASWEAPSKTGLPLSGQKLYDFKTGTYGVGIHSLTVSLPVCASNPSIVRYYQADLLRGSSPTTAQGTSDYAKAGEAGRLIDWKVGGEACPTPATPVTPVTPASTTPTKTLPATGPQGIIAVSAAIAIAAAAAHNAYLRRRILGNL